MWRSCCFYRVIAIVALNCVSVQTEKNQKDRMLHKDCMRALLQGGAQRACIGIFKLWRCTLSGRRQICSPDHVPNFRAAEVTLNLVAGGKLSWLLQFAWLSRRSISFPVTCTPPKEVQLEQRSSVKGPQIPLEWLRGSLSPRNQSPGHQQPIDQVVLGDNHSLTKAKQKAAWQQRSLFFRCVS